MKPREHTALTSRASVDDQRERRGEEGPGPESTSKAQASILIPRLRLENTGLHVTRPPTPPQELPQASVERPAVAPTTPRATGTNPHNARESVSSPATARGPIAPPPPSRHMGGGMTTPRNQSIQTPRVSSIISHANLLSPRFPFFCLDQKTVAHSLNRKLTHTL